jgi:hypothetical protein
MKLVLAAMVGWRYDNIGANNKSVHDNESGASNSSSSYVIV